MTPKFSVGEVVILQSKQVPQCNGECTVLEVLDPDFWNESYGYVTTTPVPEKLAGAGAWDESALRKKHQPGGMSFTELMVNLSQHVEAPSHS